MSTIHAKLQAIQSELKAPKSQTNSFGKYRYRSCEDILEAVKPLLKEQGLTLTLSDEMVDVGGRIYVKATAKITGQDGSFDLVNAFARESVDKKGMDEAQITGAASSYARKYALNGLFCIDDTKDADTMDNTKPAAPKTREESDKCSTGDVVGITKMCAETGTDIKELYKFFNVQGAPTKAQAESMLLSLKKKLSTILDKQALADENTANNSVPL